MFPPCSRNATPASGARTINQRRFWRELFSARGRSGRGRFWAVIGYSWLALIALGALIALATPVLGEVIVTVIALPIMIAVLVVGVLNSVKRLHDLGRSGWWLLLVMVIGAVVSLPAEVGRLGGDPELAAAGALLQLLFTLAYLGLLGALPSQKRSNRFGDPPAGTPEPQPA